MGKCVWKWEGEEACMQASNYFCVILNLKQRVTLSASEKKIFK